jgi:hypothetical protein
MLIALGKSSLTPGAVVEFVDHAEHTHLAAREWRKRLTSIADRLGLRVTVRLDGARVFVRSSNHVWRNPYQKGE